MILYIALEANMNTMNIHVSHAWHRFVPWNERFHDAIEFRAIFLQADLIRKRDK